MKARGQTEKRVNEVLSAAGGLDCYPVGDLLHLCDGQNRRG